MPNNSQKYAHRHFVTACTSCFLLGVFTATIFWSDSLVVPAGGDLQSSIVQNEEANKEVETVKGWSADQIKAPPPEENSSIDWSQASEIMQDTALSAGVGAAAGWGVSAALGKENKGSGAAIGAGIGAAGALGKKAWDAGLGDKVKSAFGSPPTKPAELSTDPAALSGKLNEAGEKAKSGFGQMPDKEQLTKKAGALSGKAGDAAKDLKSKTELAAADLNLGSNGLPRKGVSEEAIKATKEGDSAVTAALSARATQGSAMPASLSSIGDLFKKIGGGIAGGADSLLGGAGSDTLAGESPETITSWSGTIYTKVADQAETWENKEKGATYTGKVGKGKIKDEEGVWTMQGQGTMKFTSGIERTGEWSDGGIKTGIESGLVLKDANGSTVKVARKGSFKEDKLTGTATAQYTYADGTIKYLVIKVENDLTKNTAFDSSGSFLGCFTSKINEKDLRATQETDKDTCDLQSFITTCPAEQCTTSYFQK